MPQLVEGIWKLLIKEERLTLNIRAPHINYNDYQSDQLQSGCTQNRGTFRNSGAVGYRCGNCAGNHRVEQCRQPCAVWKQLGHYPGICSYRTIKYHEPTYKEYHVKHAEARDQSVTFATCFKCGQTGHLSRACPFQITQIRQTPTTPQLLPPRTYPCTQNKV